jgi:hypothetical protein
LTAGSSGTPLAKKLGIREGDRVALANPPAGLDSLLAPLPASVVLLRRAVGPLDVAILFATRRAGLARRLERAARLLERNGGLWVCWPKRTSGVATDLTEHVVREIGLAAGLVDNKVCAVDDTWSGLRFVYRLQDREV